MKIIRYLAISILLFLSKVASFGQITGGKFQVEDSLMIVNEQYDTFHNINEIDGLILRHRISKRLNKRSKLFETCFDCPENKVQFIAQSKKVIIVHYIEHGNASRPVTLIVKCRKSSVLKYSSFYTPDYLNLAGLLSDFKQPDRKWN